jgi:hypothetical protein
METPARKSTPRETELAVLDKSRRRCALCFHFDGDLREKHGQLAHLDHDPSNYAEANLAFLCLFHHDEYDLTTSQRKGYTIHEAKTARDRLYAVISTNGHLASAPPPPPRQSYSADRRTLSKLRMVMDDSVLKFLRSHNFAYDTFPGERLVPLQTIEDYHFGAEHEFLDAELEGVRKVLIVATAEFLKQVRRRTRPVPKNEHSRWIGGFEGLIPPPAIQDAAAELRELADAAWKSYDSLIRTARHKFQI